MASYNPLIKPKAHLDRNGFDLSQSHKFTAKPGMLLPILSIDCVPNDYHEIDLMSLMKTMPVHTDAFVRMKQHFEFFFVPYKQLWRHWHQFITQNQAERISTLVTGNNVPHVPCFSFGDIVNRLENFGTTSSGWFKDSQGIPLFYNLMRLIDLLGYGSINGMVEYDHLGKNISLEVNRPDLYNAYYLNVFRAAAYNKIWYDYYRNKWYDNNPDYIYSWNFDDIGNLSTGPQSLRDCDIVQQRGSGVLVGDPDKNYANGLFQLHYRQWKKDLFMSVMPSQQFGAVSAVDLGSVEIIAERYNSSSNTTPLVQLTDGRLRNATGESQNFNFNFNIPSAFDVYQLRKAEVLQKWKETTLRAGQSAESQYRGHFGTSSKWIDEETCEFLGSISSDVEINPIYSTAETSQASLGEIAGRGQSFASGKKIKFKADDFGVLMCLYSIVPESEYDSVMFDKANTLSQPFDFFTPEFEDLGLEPVLEWQLGILGDLGQGVVDPTYINTVVGYTARYSMYKTAIDKIHGGFMSIGETSDDIISQNVGYFNSWTIPRSDLNYLEQDQLTTSQFYISPTIDKSIFLDTGFDPATDHYLVNAHFGIKSVRPMSVLGLPQW